MKPYSIILFIFFFSIGISLLSAQSLTPPDSILGTWQIDSIKTKDYVLTQKQLGEIGSLRLLANHLLVIRAKDKPDSFHSYRFDGKKIDLIEDKTAFIIEKLSDKFMVIYSKNEGQEIRTVYKKVITK